MSVKSESPFVWIEVKTNSKESQTYILNVVLGHNARSV